ncbi:hypothetical protein [Sphingobium yanoikuyae]|uniref:hypothetical protein n=1 Tax=Sphingobium yanoikuyae TaxID=13690 RepID=UPI0035C77623
MADEQEAATFTATIVAPGRKHDVRVGVNGEVKKFAVNKPVEVTEYQREALVNAGYQLVVEGDKSTAGEEGSAPAVDQGPDDNRTEPHQNDQQPTGEVVEGGAGARDADGAPVIKGGDEPARDPLDHDGDGVKGGSEPKKPVALTGKTTAELEQIAADEDVDLTGEDIKTNADRIAAIEAARAKA